MHPWMNDVNDGCLAMGEGNTEKILEFSAGITRCQATIIYIIHPQMHSMSFHLSCITLIEGHIVEPSSTSGTLCVKKNPVKRTRLPGVPVARWLKHPTSITEVVGLIPTWNSEIFSLVQ